MQPQLGIRKRFIPSLLLGDRISLGWGLGRGLFQVYLWGTESAVAGDLEEVYCKIVSGGQMLPQLGIWKRFIRSLSGLTDADSAEDLEEVY